MLLHVVARQEIEERLDFFKAVVFAFAGKVSDAGNRVMSHGAAEFFCRDFFRRDRFDDRRAGEEHVRRIFNHEYKVHQGRAINGTTGTGPHDDGQLRNDAGSRRIVHKDAAETGQGIDAFLNAAPPESLMPMTGAPILRAISCIWAILWACISPRDPPSTVKSSA